MYNYTINLGDPLSEATEKLSDSLVATRGMPHRVIPNAERASLSIRMPSAGVIHPDALHARPRISLVE